MEFLVLFLFYGEGLIMVFKEIGVKWIGYLLFDLVKYML